MTMTVGRVGLDITMSNPMARSASGQSVSLTGRLTASTALDAAFMREQFLALVSGAERFVPVTFSDDPRLDGYYVVTGLGVEDHPKSIVSGTVGYAYSLDLVRASKATAQIIQLCTEQGVRANDDSIGATTGQWAVQVPAAATFAGAVGGSPFTTIQYEDDINASSGSLMGYGQTTTAGSPVYSSWRIPAGNYYLGACKLEQNTTGSTWRTVAGYVMRTDIGTRISNGFVRCTFDGPDLILEGVKSVGTWSTAQTVTLTGDSLTMPADGYWYYDIVRNDPWAVTVRQIGNTLSGFVPVVVYVTMRRGSRVVEVVIESTSAESWGAARNPDVAETALTGGWCATTATDGYKLTFASSPTSANAGGLCGITAASDTNTWAVGIGMSPGSSTWQAPQDLVYSFHGGRGGGTTATVVEG